MLCRWNVYHLSHQGSPLKDGDANNYFFQKRKRDRIFERLGDYRVLYEHVGFVLPKILFGPKLRRKRGRREEGREKLSQ